MNEIVKIAPNFPLQLLKVDIINMNTDSSSAIIVTARVKMQLKYRATILLGMVLKHTFLMENYCRSNSCTNDHKVFLNRKKKSTT